MSSNEVIGLAGMSPLASYLGSFIEESFLEGHHTLRTWVLVALAISLHWLVLMMPSIVWVAYLDRKLGADIQMRIGPNRVPVAGFFQFVADVIKMFFKEDKTDLPRSSWLFRWGTVISLVVVFSAMGSIPVAQDWATSNVDSGVLCVVFAMIFSNLMLFWTAYAADNRWSVLSAFRILPVVGSYTVPLGVSLIPAILITGTMNFDTMVRNQGGLPWQWTVFHDPGALISAISLFITVMVWQARLPFDHYLADGEINGGFGALYSGLRRGLLTVLEFGSIILGFGFMVSVYLGGWQTPFSLDSFGRAANLVQWLVFSLKALLLVLFYIWVHWSLPRLRMDQVVLLSWRILTPAGLAGAFISAVWLIIFNRHGLGGAQ